MAWIILLLSGCLEAVWAIALDKSQGFSKLGPSIIFFIALGQSMGGLAYAMKSIPLGTAYAVWVGVGVILTVIYTFATGEDQLTVAKVLFIAMIAAGVTGLKMSH